MALVPVAAVVVLLGAAMPAAGAPRAIVESVALRTEPTPAIELGVTARVEPAVRRLANPPRVYLDLADATLGAKVARTLAGAGVVERVRLAQFDAATVRVVIDLAAPSRVDVEATGHGLRLVVAGDARAAAAPAKRASAAPAKTAAPAPAKAEALPPPPAEPVAAAPLPPDVPRLLVVRTDRPLAAAVAAATPTRRDVPLELQERIARRAAADDAAGIVALYAANLRPVRQDADSATRAAVVDALRELGLVHAARKLLGPATPGEAPALRVARAEVALGAGEAVEAAVLLAGLDEAAVDPALGPKLRRARVRLALAQGDLDAASAGIGGRATPELRAELAAAGIRAGRTASETRACRRAVAAFRTALEADGGRTARAAAGAGLVRASLACGDRDGTMHGLGVLAESPHPLFRRAATAIAKTQVEAARPAAAVGWGG